MAGTIEAKRAAAVAAVYAYLAQQGGAAEAGSAGAQAGTAGFQPSLWALYGRQAIMNQRIRMQARRRA
jgi:hypothetical protein